MLIKEKMKLAIDVYYYEGKAKTVGVLFNEWEDENPIRIESTYINEVEDYESGSFYKRELPCIVKLLENTDLKEIKVIIIDGYVYLDNNRKHGLGYYLYNYLDKKIPVIGVAKKSFHNNNLYVTSLLRGKSNNPLYITSIGIDLSEAVESIKKMHGVSRIPTLLKLTDRQTRVP